MCLPQVMSPSIPLIPPLPFLPPLTPPSQPSGNHRAVVCPQSLLTEWPYLFPGCSRGRSLHCPVSSVGRFTAQQLMFYRPNDLRMRRWPRWRPHYLGETTSKLATVTLGVFYRPHSPTHHHPPRVGDHREGSSDQS